MELCIHIYIYIYICILHVCTYINLFTNCSSKHQIWLPKTVRHLGMVTQNKAISCKKPGTIAPCHQDAICSNSWTPIFRCSSGSYKSNLGWGPSQACHCRFAIVTNDYRLFGVASDRWIIFPCNIRISLTTEHILLINDPMNQRKVLSNLRTSKDDKRHQKWQHKLLNHWWIQCLSTGSWQPEGWKTHQLPLVLKTNPNASRLGGRRRVALSAG